MAKEKIVVIDDSPIVRKLAELALEEEGYKVYTAEDGEEGLRICEEVRPSVILVDFIMPRISGYQFCEAARDNELLKDIPIILITGKGEDVGKKFAEKFGVIDYFIKPFKSEILVEKVNAIIYAQKLQSGELTLPPETEAGEAASEMFLGEHEGRQQSVYGRPDVAEEPASGPEPVSAGTGEVDAESSAPVFSFDEAELSVEQPGDVMSQAHYTLGQPQDVISQPDDTFGQPHDAFTQQGDAFARPIDTFELPHDNLAQPFDAFAELTDADDIGVTGISPAFTGAYDFETGSEFKEMQALESMAPSGSYRHDGPVGETLEGVMRRYFSDELPDLIEKNLEDVLRKHGIIKDSSILLSGNLQAISGVEVLKLIDAQKLTGKFFAYSSSGSAEIYFAKGMVVFALTSKQGKTLTAKRIAIIKKGPLMEVEDRSREGILDAVAMVAGFNEGGFFFEEMSVPKALLELNHRCNVIALVLEALRIKGEKTDDVCKIAGSRVLVRTISDMLARSIRMSAAEIEIFSVIDGTRSVADIGGQSDLGMAGVVKILCRMVKAGIVADKGGL
jgi:DNA-binding response OmpR family regulator